MEEYDVIIVGTGPAGIFAAWELLTSVKPLRILMLDRGLSLTERLERISRKGYRRGEAEPDVLAYGWGGAGAFSDGKLNLSPEVGGFLKEYLDESQLHSLIEYVDSIYLRFGAPHVLEGTGTTRIQALEDEALRHGLKLIPFPIRHIGTDRCAQVLGGFMSYMKDKVTIRFNTEVCEIIVMDGKAQGVKTTTGEEIYGKFVIIAPGRAGAGWLAKEIERLGLSTVTNPVDIGLRVETSAPIMKPLTDVVYEAKLIFYSRQFDDQVRTFCMNPYGEVVKEYHDNLYLVNGHSYSTRRSNNTNFAILVSVTFTEPFHEPIAYGQYIARLANLIGGGILIQRLGDLLHGRRSTEERIKRSTVQPTLKDVTPGDLSFVIPYRYLCDILEMLQAMDKLTPGLYSRDTLLYGVEAKFYSLRLKLSSNFETQIQNLFAIGDGAGITRGLIQASVSGVVAGREILSRI